MGGKTVNGMAGQRMTAREFLEWPGCSKAEAGVTYADMGAPPEEGPAPIRKDGADGGYSVTEWVATLRRRGLYVLVEVVRIRSEPGKAFREEMGLGDGPKRWVRYELRFVHVLPDGYPPRRTPLRGLTRLTHSTGTFTMSELEGVTGLLEDAQKLIEGYGG